VSAELHDAVVRPSHYNTERYRHEACGEPIEVIDITRRHDFCAGNALKYIMRAGFKGDELEDLRKARRYLDYLIEELVAQQETAEILADESTMEAIREGDRDMLEGRETAGHSMQLDMEQDTSPSWPSGTTLGVQYQPTGDSDPWSGHMYSEYATGNETVDEFKGALCMHVGFGNPDGFMLLGRTGPLEGTARLKDVASPQEVLQLVRSGPDGDCGGEGQCCLDRTCTKFAECARQADPADLGCKFPAPQGCGFYPYCQFKGFCPGTDECASKFAVASPDRTQL
jgi:hypothetical protein